MLLIFVVVNQAFTGIQLFNGMPCFNQRNQEQFTFSPELENTLNFTVSSNLSKFRKN